ncbi:hypothetical protein [Paucilactobacillus nenjiangensis]|uniref:Uncharacterized protein n=1 Tax=Paucilactobacillus nenjiangensis TaxID=1296540 RepID=A0A5P1X4Y9_9LACO|nr:hypothetical protein [Paucilactobacillus nenjiangensis]QER67561.1 hypothetical protein F0161_06625 [Paucilactobacillus nenjiangensis]
MLLRDIGVYIKFVEKQHVQGTLKGEIHFEPLQNFRNLENNEGDEIIGDKFEGSRVYNIKKTDKISVGIYDEDNQINEWIPLHEVSGSINKGLNNLDIKSIGIASMFYLTCDKNFEMYNLDESKGTCDLKLNEETLNDLQKFNDDKRTPILIYDVFKFRKLLKKSGLSYGPIEYYDENDAKGFFNDNDPYLSGAFKKRNKYSNQKEFRIANKLLNPNKSEEVRIGSLKNIANSFDTVNDLNKFRILGSGLYTVDSNNQLES